MVVRMTGRRRPMRCRGWLSAAAGLVTALVMAGLHVIVISRRATRQHAAARVHRDLTGGRPHIVRVGGPGR